VTEVSALEQPSPEGNGGTAAVSILLRFRSGALGTVICGCLAQEKQIGCRVFTPRGQLVLDGLGLQVVAFRRVRRRERSGLLRGRLPRRVFRVPERGGAPETRGRSAAIWPRR